MSRHICHNVTCNSVGFSRHTVIPRGNSEEKITPFSVCFRQKIHEIGWFYMAQWEIFSCGSACMAFCSHILSLSVGEWRGGGCGARMDGHLSMVKIHVQTWRYNFWDIGEVLQCIPLALSCGASRCAMLLLIKRFGGSHSKEIFKVWLN